MVAKCLDDLPQYFGPKDFEAITGIDTHTQAVWRCTRRVLIPYRKIGRIVRYEREEIRQFLAEGAVNVPVGGGE